MSPVEKRLHARFARRLREQAPALEARVLAAWKAISAQLSQSELARLLASENIDGIISELLTDKVLDRALAGVRVQIRLQTENSVRWATQELPRRALNNASILFNVENPDHIDAVRQLSTRVLTTLKGDVREGVRAMAEAGIRAGANPRETSRHIREIVGLSKNQAEYVSNLREALNAGDLAKVRRYKLLDKRFNLDNLTPQRIDRIVGLYRKAWIKSHSETVSITTTLDSMRLGQDISTREAIEAGILDGGRLMKRWSQVDRPTKRDEHVPLNGEVVPFDQPFSNGSMIPGDQGEYRCACIPIIFQRRAA